MMKQYDSVDDYIYKTWKTSLRNSEKNKILEYNETPFLKKKKLI